MHLNLEAMCPFLPRLRLQQVVSIRDHLSRISFESVDHFSKQQVDEIIGRDVLATGDENATLQKSGDHSHSSLITSRGWGQSKDTNNR